MSLKHRVISSGFRLLAVTRADRWLAPVARGLGAILMFHHVRPALSDPFQPNALLSITPEHLDRTLSLVRRLGLEIIPLDAVPERLRAGQGGFVALTFDDGYRDNRDFALPILRRHDAPWTMFVTTDFASGRGRLWWLELEEAIRASERLRLGERSFAAGTPEEKAATFAAIYGTLRAGPETVLRETIASWCDEARIDRDRMVRDLCLDWAEIGELAREPGVTIGAHTLTHPMLAKHDATMAGHEIASSRAILSERLGRDVRHLAYPVGDPTSAGVREFDLARAAGFEIAVTTRPGHLFAGHADHLTALPRVSVNGLYQSDDAMRSLLSGVPFLAWNRGRRINVA